MRACKAKIKSSRKNVLIVLFSHGLLLFFLYFQPTVSLKKNRSIVIKECVAPVPKIEEKSSVNSNLPKKTNPPISQEKKNSFAKVGENPHQVALKKLKSSLDELKNLQKSSSFQQVIDIPKPVELVFLEDKEKKQFSAESEELLTLLIGELQEQLKLPEEGKVKVEISISPQGRIVKMQVIDFSSEKNSEYLKNSLPTLVFPWFNRYSKETRNITIAFSNEN